MWDLVNRGEAESFMEGGLGPSEGCGAKGKKMYGNNDNRKTRNAEIWKRVKSENYFHYPPQKLLSFSSAFQHTQKELLYGCLALKNRYLKRLNTNPNQ